MIVIITSEHKTTRINDSHCKLDLKKVHNSFFPKYCTNMRHTSLLVQCAVYIACF